MACFACAKGPRKRLVMLAPSRYRKRLVPLAPSQSRSGSLSLLRQRPSGVARYVCIIMISEAARPLSPSRLGTGFVLYHHNFKSGLLRHDTGRGLSHLRQRPSEAACSVCAIMLLGAARLVARRRHHHGIGSGSFRPHQTSPGADCLVCVISIILGTMGIVTAPSVACLRNRSYYRSAP